MKVTEEQEPFFPGVRETLLSLKGRFRIGMFTGVTRKQVDTLGDFLDFFELIVAGEEAIKPKPAPDTLLYMAEKMGLDPKECVYVGDMPQDMTLARNAGMAAVGLENRMFSAEALTDGGATTVIKALGELTDLPLLGYAPEKNG